MKVYEVGYTTGVFDLFHIGHLNILKQSKERCDFLIVGISTDELAFKLKGKIPIIPFQQRVKIMESIKYVDLVVPEINADKFEAWKELRFSVLFKGSDAQKKDSYKKYESDLKSVGVDVIYFPYTEEISSTKIKERLDAQR